MKQFDMKNYGKELILDIHDCYENRFNRKDIARYFDELVELIDMKPMKRTWWDYFWYPKWFIKIMGWDNEDKVYGASAVQFIRTSNITIHVIYNLRQIYLNIFSCKDFDAELVTDFSQCFFWGEIVNKKIIDRL